VHFLARTNNKQLVSSPNMDWSLKTPITERPLVDPGPCVFWAPPAESQKSRLRPSCRPPLSTFGKRTTLLCTARRAPNPGHQELFGYWANRMDSGLTVVLLRCPSASPVLIPVFLFSGHRQNCGPVEPCYCQPDLVENKPHSIGSESSDK
jgi:hypothetical protein